MTHVAAALQPVGLLLPSIVRTQDNDRCGNDSLTRGAVRRDLSERRV